MAEVLVVDDDADIRSLLQLALTLEGHTVATAAGGQDALSMIESLETARPVVILDVQMPDLDGWEVLERIRRSPELDSLPVMLCTVRAGAADYARGWGLGCDAYVPKPFDLPSLAVEVAHLSRVPADELVALRHTRVPAPD